MEILTYRFMGHSMGDPERYREKKEIEKWRENDPIGIFRKQLLAKKTATAKALDEIEERAMQDALKAVEFAESSPEPSPEALWENVYVE
jgi:pyruvate dehydrogenase E1 component alpha subunit